MFKSTIESRTKNDVPRDHDAWLKEARKRCLNEQESVIEKVPEKIIHQIAKYEEVDLKASREKSKDSIKAASYTSVNNLIIFNTVCIVLLFLYLRYLNKRINELYLINAEQPS